MSGQYDNRNTFVLFGNQNRTSDRAPTHTGTVNVDGQEYFLDGWLSETKDGRKYIRGKIKPKLAQDHAGGARNPPARTQGQQRDEYSTEPF